MKEEPYHIKVGREAAERVGAILALPIDEHNDMNDDERFDPWKLRYYGANSP